MIGNSVDEACKNRLHWVGSQPTPYNDVLFRALSAERDIDLTVHYSDRLSPGRPWGMKLAQDYRARYYRRLLGVDWHVVSLPLREKNAFFVIASWIHPTAIILINLLSLMGMRFALWTDTPNLARKRNPVFAFFRSHWLKWVFSKATNTIGTGRPGVKALSVMGAPQARLLNLPFFLDLNAFARDISVAPLENRSFRFVSSGRIKNSIKGHDLAISALAMVKRKIDQQFEYYIAGKGPDEEQLKSLVADLGIEKSVKFLGWVEPEELRRLYMCSDILIHPSPLHDPYPNAVLEAMAAGLVVLGSDACGSVIDRIEHGSNGFIHPAGNLQVLTEQIEFLLRNPDKIPEIGRRAQATAKLWPVERGVQIVKKIVLDTSVGKFPKGNNDHPKYRHTCG